MKGKIFCSLAVLFAFAVLLFAPQKAEAIPAFARQTGQNCTACHFQHFPNLTSYGRNFKGGGFTQVGGQSLLEGDMLSLPSVLNAALVTKIRYQKTNGDNDAMGTNKGEYQLPDEAALFLGGRVGEHIGFILEAQMADETSPMFASFKLPIGYEVGETHLEIVPFTTDGLGPAFSFEVLGTGAIKNIRALEHRTEISAQQYIGTAVAAQGIGFVAYNPMGFFNYTIWAPETGKHVDAGPYLHYVRGALTPEMGDWDLAFGFQWWGGTTKYDGDTRQKADAWAIDAQAQGKVANLPLGIYLSYATADKSDPAGTDNKTPQNIFNTSTNDDKNAWAVLAELGVIPNKATLALGYRSGKNGDPSGNGKDAQNAITVGATYLLAQNFQLQFNNTWYNGDYYDLRANNEDANGDMLSTLMIFAAF